MKAQMFVQAIDAALAAGVPLYIEGLPGVGKSQTVEAVGRARGRKVVVIIGSTLDPTDFGGIPVPRKDGSGVDLLLPRFAEEILEAYETTGRRPVAFLDELPDAPLAVQGPAYRFVLEGEVARRILPADRVAAGNPPEVSLQQSSLPPALANRFVHWKAEVDPRYIARGFQEGFEGLVAAALRPEPPAGVVEARIREVKVLVGLYLERNPGAVIDLPKDPVSQGGPWPSPRSWEILARVVGAAQAIGYGVELQTALAYGAVGGRGYEFMHFMKDLDLPDPGELLRDPKLLPVQDDRAFAALMGAVRYATESLEERWEAAWALLRFAANRGQAELAAKASRGLIQAWDEAKKRGVNLPITQKLLGERLAQIGARLAAL